MKKRYVQTLILLLAALLVSHDAKAQGESTESTGPTVRGNVFGGGNQADVQTNTLVNIGAGQVDGNVYGGGNLGDVGTIDKSNTDYNYTWKQTDGSTGNVAENNKITGANANTGICTVNITGGTIGVEKPADATKQGNVFGAGRGSAETWWCEKAIVYATNVSVSAGTVKGTVYGGGEVGRVEDDAKVTIGVADAADGTAPIITGNVFGAGAGLVTHGYSALVRGNAAVTVQGTAQVGGSVYGGGETASVGRFTVVGGLPKHPDSGGKCTVTIQDNAKIGTSGTGHNVYGACKGVTPAYDENNYKSVYSMQIYENRPSDTPGDTWEYYTTYEEGYTGQKFIKRYYETEAEYLDFLKTLALTSHPTVTIDESATVYGSVYGGGERGLTLGNVDVNIKGGIVEQDVYGGGALADTNAGNWDADGYTEVTGLTTGAALEGELYTLSGTTYTLTSDQTAAEGATYYRKGKWADATKMTANYTTTVDLTGGTVKGDAYGGGLGQKNGFNGETSDIAAVVWGDIQVNLGSNTSGSSATAFHITNYTGDHSGVVKSGRVFGCNNLLGSPQGDVKVTVYKTVYGNIHRTTEDSGNTGSATKNDGQHHNYEVAAVYGGGNLADYTATGKKASVIIETCDVSIESVYGGGNAAEVPETYVLVNGAYEIGTVFGGGNGNDPYTTDGGTNNWVDNPGANVNGNANTLLTGGYIHEAYGGSNRRGTITGNVTIDVGTDGVCTLDVGKVVGAGKNADVNGNLIVIMGCKPSEKVPVLFAGADDANVYGNVELTITSGNFGQVFGGNNAGGAIYGHIKLNIEETGNCDTPITIDSLYLGGNQAAYSVYGYKTEGSKLVPQSADELKAAIAADPENVGKTADELTGLFNSQKQEDPELNIVACTYIGQVFGGGYGTGAYMYADPKVNINMIQGSKSSGIPTFMTADPRVKDLGLSSSDNPNSLGVIGTVYGGGNAADVYGNPTVNIGTLSKVQLHESLKEDGVTYNMSEEKDVLGAYIVGNVFGGGKGQADTFNCEKGMIGKDGDGVDNPDGGTTVNIYNGTVLGSVYGGGEIGRVEKNTMVTIGQGDGVSSGTPTSAPYIRGNVFGAGKGLETHGYAALVRGNPTVTIQGNAKVLKSVYGGGEIASVARYKVVEGVPVALAQVKEGQHSGWCTVNVKGYAEIGPETEMKMYHEGVPEVDDAPDDAGHVFAAGRGVLPENYTYADNEHRPKRMLRYDSETIDKITYWEYAKTYPADYSGPKDIWQYFKDEDEYFDFIQTLALATQTSATIGGNALVKGSVYGGSENGLVQYDTNVTIEGDCQIGCGKNTTGRHPAPVWGENYTVPDDGTDLECASWEYDGKTGAPYDPYAKYKKDGKYYYDEACTNYADGGAKIAKDGHTYYGNVFGGGSGSVPYFDTNKHESRYIMTAGWVKGNTHVTINGGHILTNVYGGCEATNVDGTAYVTMTGGTVGVPRTLEQIVNHPLTCYLFGAGKGDQRVFYNKSTNVKDVEVSITGGRIYGSVFGGGEDGHVLRNVTMTIGQQSTTGEGTEAVTTTSGPVIGTWGTSYVDGNVFGGGRGFGGDAYTAGNVAGSVKMEIKGGTMLGSIYGGGRLGSVGYGLFDAETNGQPTQGYGEMRADTDTEEGFTDGTSNFFTKGRGHIDITISGGTIGNTHEYIMPNNSNIPTGLPATISDWTTENWNTWKAHNHIAKTEFDTATGRLTHTKGGNVFAGGMGRFYQLDGTTPISVIDWWKLGCVKSTKLTITGGNIKSNVYGGGEQGWTSGYHTADGKNLSTEISITGGTIGTEVKDGNVTKYTFGSVFGGGYGSALEKLDHGNNKQTNPKFQAGRVKHSTKVDITGDAKVLASVYGGGEVASVGYGFQSYHADGVIGEAELTSADDAANTYVSISGDAVIGKAKDETNNIYYGGATMGNVYGGGSGNRTIVRCGLILGNTNVNISGGTIYHNIYGGGAYGSVGNFDYETQIDPDHGTKKVYGVEKLHTTGTGTANITITGGIIGVDGRENGMVFGSSRGDVLGNMQRDDYMAWVNKTNVTIGTSGSSTGPQINGSVYGGGENGHVLTDTEIAIHGGTIGIESGAAIGGQEGAWYGNRGNVYGGGCGTDIFEVGNKSYFNKTAGIVRGNATITLDGGHVVRNIYGGGAMGSVGKFTRGEKPAGEAEDANVPGPITACADNTGKCTITISGGEVGPGNLEMPLSAGHVFGAGRGEVHDPESYPNLERVVYVNNTEVTVKGTAYIKGSVYGGSESGHVLGSTNVKIQGGQIGMGRAIKTPYEESVFTSAPSETSDWECPSWTYDTTDADGGKAYDMYAGTEGYDAKGGVKVATDGHTFYGNVFGGGSGYTPYSAGKWLESAGVVKGNATVEITGGHILTNVYGGNECTDVEGKCTVTMSGGTVGVPRTDAQIRNHPVTCYVFGAGKGDKRVLFNTWTNVAETEVNINGGTIFGSVLGGGEDGHVLGNAVTTIEEKDGKTVTIGSVGTSGADGNVFGGGRGSRSALTAGVVGGNIALNVKSGTIKGCVYGGGRMASVGTHFTNPADPGYGVVTDDEAHGNITVNLTGGTIGHDVYGGCMGATGTDQLGESRSVKLHLNQGVGTDQKGCIIGGYVFGCNNVNSSPRLSSLVHIHATQNKNGVSISDKKDDYDVAGVFGGGNQADFVPTLAGEGDPQTTEVIVEGCDLTSIKEVYGGGYGAATPGTSVLIKGTKIIDNVFGGGYGAGATNPGANVGFRTGGNTEYGGEGKAVVKLMAGRVNNVYGGSNTKGDIRGGSNVTNVAKDGSPGCCDKLEVGKIYGGGKDAEMAGGTEIVLGCMPNDWIEEIYAGAQNADVGNDVMLTLTSGKFGRVFGGNKSGGKLDGSITVNIEESSECGTPIVIGELYGGGNEAPYSAYGYKEDPANPGKWIPLEKGEEGALSTPYPGPVLNIKSFTSIGNVYGGGFGSTATVIGNPQVFVNEVNVEDNNVAYDVGEDTNVPALIDGVKVKLYPHEADKIGVIGNVFGGGNAAKVVGDTHVNIGTVETVKFESLTDESITGSDKRVSKTVVGADIRGNVYGGGNEAEVTGDTNVVIGKEEVTTSGTGTTP